MTQRSTPVPRQRGTRGESPLRGVRRVSQWGALGGTAIYTDHCRHYVRPMANKNVHEFNDLNFEQEVLGASGKVLVDFTASWCGPCKRLAPIVDEVADALEGKVKVGKLDIDEAPMIASKFQVRGVPTLMVFEGGRPVQTSVGLVSKSKVLALLESE